MQHYILFLLTSAVCLPALPAQEGVRLSAAALGRVAPAGELPGGGEESRAVQLPVDPADYVPMPAPAYGRPTQAAGDILVRDLATGSERLVPIPSGRLPREAWVAGWNPGTTVQENMTRSWTEPSMISDTSEFPWRAQCRIYIYTTSDGKDDLCSGTLIDPRVVLTAGHCVHGGPGSSWATNVVVSPGTGSLPNYKYGEARAEAMATYTAWAWMGSSIGDQAYIRLDRPVGFLTGQNGPPPAGGERRTSSTTRGEDGTKSTRRG